MYSREEEKSLKLEFWRKFENSTRKLAGQRGNVKVWIGDKTGVKGVDLRFDVSRKKIAVALEINHRQEDRRLLLYEKLDACKSIFEQAYGQSLIWDFAFEKEFGEEVCRVYSEMDGDMLISEQWPKIFKFMTQHMLQMEKAFLEVDDFLKYDELGK